ncbi:uncharacterized protein [Solanum lycopersicum]|uniref:uncharacterized protein n=1 Tax=Solanum lycopersicum TaxID=4081 RepID=UPI0037481326
MVVDTRSRMSLFVAGFSHLSIKEDRAAMLIVDMDISRLMIYCATGSSPSSTSAPSPKNENHYNIQNLKAKPAYSQGSMALEGSKSPAGSKCGRNNSSTCCEVSTGCFKCGHNGNITRKCPKNKQGNDPQARSSFLNPYVSMNFDVIPEQLSELFSVSTLVSDSILAETVYHDYLIFPQSEDYHG